MNRSEYTACMTPHMQGKGKTKEQRRMDMCVGAKLCTGKATSRNGEQPLPVARLKVRLLELDLTFKRTNRGSEWRGIKIRR